MKNLTGDNTKQINEIIEKHQVIINKIRLSDLARKIVWKGSIGVPHSSIRYGLSPYSR